MGAGSQRHSTEGYHAEKCFVLVNASICKTTGPDLDPIRTASGLGGARGVL